MGIEWRHLAGRIIAAALLFALLSSSACSPQVPGSFLRDVSAPTPAVVATETATASRSPTLVGAALSPTATSAPATTSTAVPASASIALPTLNSAPSSVALPTLNPAPSSIATPPAFSSERARESVDYLARQIGSRPPGSPAATRVAQYIRDRLAAAGYNAGLQPYSYPIFHENRSSLLLLEPYRMEIAARAMVYSGSGTVQGYLVDCGFGRPSDFPSSGIQGKIALMERGQGIAFQDKVDAAAERGAAGVVMFNDQEGDLQATLGRQAALPVLSVLQQDGLRLRDYVGRGPTAVSLTVDAQTETISGNNVVASAAKNPNGPIVVVGAHYDSIWAGPGANDNASGVATMMELARVTRGRAYPFDLEFVAFGDEEAGLFGSKKYVEALTPDHKGRILAMINLDMVGVGDTMEFGGERSLVDSSLLIASQMGYPATDLALRGGLSSDNASFGAAGIPAVFFYRSEDPNYHTKLDTSDKVQPENLEAAGKVVLALLDQLGERR